MPTISDVESAQHFDTIKTAALAYCAWREHRLDVAEIDDVFRAELTIKNAKFRERIEASTIGSEIKWLDKGNEWQRPHMYECKTCGYRFGCQWHSERDQDLENFHYIDEQMRLLEALWKHKDDVGEHNGCSNNGERSYEYF